jgi:hypothetical protein
MHGGQVIYLLSSEWSFVLRTTRFIDCLFGCLFMIYGYGRAAICAMERQKVTIRKRVRHDSRTRLHVLFVILG